MRTIWPVFSDIVTDGAQGAEVVALAVPITGDAEELLGSVVGLVRVSPASARVLMAPTCPANARATTGCAMKSAPTCAGSEWWRDKSEP